MKKIILVLLILAGLAYAYYWYVLGINLLLDGDDAFHTASYSDFAVRIPGKPGSDASAPAWTVAAPMPTLRTYVSAAAVDGAVYVIGGIDRFIRTIDTVEAFDTARNVWSIIAPLPRPLHHTAAIAVDGLVYSIGGLEGLSFSPVSDVYVLDPRANRWTKLASLPEALGGAAAVYDGERIHVLGGAASGGTTDAHYVYDIKTNMWSAAEPLLSMREQHGSVRIGDDTYIVGGRQGNLAYALDTLDVFRGRNDQWERWESMENRRSGAGVVAYDGKIYVFGGEAPTVTFDAVEAYDPETRKWSVLESMPTARHGMGVAEVDGRMFLIGGGIHPGISVSDVNEVFTP